MPLPFLEPGSVGTWPAVSSTQREDLEHSDLQLKVDFIKSLFLTVVRFNGKILHQTVDDQFHCPARLLM